MARGHIERPITNNGAVTEADVGSVPERRPPSLKEVDLGGFT
jgi:hypothetical protein